MTQHTPTRAQDLLWRLEALGFDLFGGMMRLLPLDSASDFGAWLLRWLGPATSANRTVETNLRIAFPELPDADVRRLRNAQWRELGRLVAEFAMVDRIMRDPSRVEVVNGERLTALAKGGKPAVLVSGHFSNFEIIAATVVQAGVRCHIAYRATNNPYFDQRIRRSRARYGVTLFARKGADGAREMLRALGRGDSVGILNDQKFNAGVASPLFGATAYTAPSPAVFALRFGVPMLPMSVQRVRKARFRVVVHEPIVVEDTGDRTADIEAGVRRYNAFLESCIRERPAEWFWVHKRWPKEMYKKGG
jgi:KDO2-lipid IV(A) lauroyltransferase